MFLDVVVDHLCKQLHVDEVRIVLNEVVDDLKEQFIAENRSLIHLDVIWDNLIEHLIVNEDLLVVLNEVNNEVHHHVHIDVRRSIWEVVLVENLLQQFVVEDIHVVFVHIADDDLIENVDIEQPRVVSLYVGADDLVEHLLTDNGGAILSDIIIDDLHKHGVVNDYGGQHIDIAEGHTTIDGDKPRLGDTIKPNNRSNPVGAYGFPIRASK